MGRFVIVAYKPKAGMAARLDAVVAKHLRVLAERQSSSPNRRGA